MNKVFTFALALSSIAFVSAPALALPVNTPFEVSLDFNDGAYRDITVGSITFRTPVFDSVSADYQEACRYIGQWTVAPGVSTSANFFIDEIKINGFDDCEYNSYTFVETDLMLAGNYAVSYGFDVAFQKRKIVRLVAGEDDDSPEVHGSIKFANGATYSLELEKL